MDTEAAGLPHSIAILLQVGAQMALGGGLIGLAEELAGIGLRLTGDAEELEGDSPELSRCREGLTELFALTTPPTEAA